MVKALLFSDKFFIFMSTLLDVDGTLLDIDTKFA
ncbi:MAG: hypothetical protein H6Q15_1172 [Bacteroidetes bacterium]|nr:hypothetical protein [Bacteroidota bacterium]